MRRPALATLLAATLGQCPARADIYVREGPSGVIEIQNRARRGKLAVREASRPAGTSDASRYDDTIREAAALYQIPEALVRAVIRVESGCDPRAVSRANACGLMQLIPETAARMLVTDIFDPRQNILGGVRYLRVLANLFNGDIVLTLAAYNAGENAVIRHGGVPPFAETEAYVEKVLDHYRRYRDERR